MPVDSPMIAVVGATGAVGREVLALLAARGHPAHRVIAATSDKSAGLTIPYGFGTVSAAGVATDVLARADLTIAAASADVAKLMVPRIVEAGGRVIDNSSAFRADPDVPLVVPEVNGDELAGGRARLVANPNCTTILLVLALEPLRRQFGVERIVVSTYQAVSGAGLEAMQELEEQTRAVLEGRKPRPRAFPEPCAFNVFAHESDVDAATGVNAEERKVIDETRRIWKDPSLRVVPTCVRVPVMRSHCESVTVTLREPAKPEAARAALAAGAGLEVVDNHLLGRFPTALRASEGDAVLVGRLRPAPDEPLDAEGRARTWCLWVAGDQLRKGAALNALQIADLLLGTRR